MAPRLWVVWLGMVVVSIQAVYADQSTRPQVLFFSQQEIIEDQTQFKQVLNSLSAKIPSTEGYEILSMAALLPLMQADDERNAAEKNVNNYLEKARQASLALDRQGAHLELEAALTAVGKSYLRYYRPKTVAQIYLLLGVTDVQTLQFDQAETWFTKALQLDPTLKLDARYSPQVREIFQRAATRNLQAEEVPVSELIRLATLGGAKAVLSVSVDGDNAASSLLNVRGAVFDISKKTYADIKTTTLEATDEAKTAAFADQLRVSLAELFPLPKTASQPTSLKAFALPSPHLSASHVPSTPWYRRWYVWAAVGGVVAISLAIVLPLSLRHDNVGVVARW